MSSHYTKAQRQALIISACAEYRDPRIDTDGSLIGNDWDTDKQFTIMSPIEAKSFLKSDDGKEMVKGLENASEFSSVEDPDLASA